MRDVTQVFAHIIVQGIAWLVVMAGFAHIPVQDIDLVRQGYLHTFLYKVLAWWCDRGICSRGGG